MTAVVLVGVDGSSSALAAVGWAAREAHRRDAVLRLVEVVEWHADAPAGPAAVTATTAARSARAEVAAADLARAVELAVDRLPATRIEQCVRGGTPAEVLAREAEGADVLVIGGPRGGWEGSLIGVGLAARVSCPLVIVDRAGDPDPRAQVVVGVDGSVDADGAVAVAFREARERGAPVEIVHAWSDAPLDGVPDLDFAAFAADVQRAVDARVAAVRARYPDVPVRRTVVRDRPAHALAEASRGAQLVVIGARGRSAALALGEVGRRVVLSAQCPVMIVGPRCPASVLAATKR